MKKVLKIFVFTVVLFPPTGVRGLFAQTFFTQWQKCVGGSNKDYFASMVPINGGGYISAGSTDSNDGDVSGNHGGYSDAWIVNYNSVGGIVWSKVYGGSGYEQFSRVIQTNDGGYLAVGSTDSNNGDVSGNHGGGDAWVVKVNNIGTIEWQKCYGGSDSEGFISVLQTPDGGYLCIGVTESNDGDVSGNHSIDFNDVWSVKINNTGSIEWQKCYGGEFFEEVHDVILISGGGFLFVGATNSTITHDWDAWVVEINSSGSIQWQKTYDGISNNYTYYNDDDYFHKVIQTTDGGFLAVGRANDITSGGSIADAWVVKLNITGNIEWQKYYAGTNAEVFNSVIQTQDNYFTIIGGTNSTDGDVSGNGGKNIWILKINQQGTIIWQRFFGGSSAESGKSLINVGNGEYILGGNTSSNDGDVSGNHGSSDGWLVKFKVTNFNLFPNYPCQDKYEHLTSEGCTGTTRWYMYLAGQTPTLISSSPNFDYLVPTNLPVQTPIFFECWCLNILNGQNLIGSSYARVLGVANYNLSSPTDDISITPPLPYNASHKIEATNKINGSSTNVEYRAEESITLLPGFQSSTNTIFKAHIGGCNQ